MIVSSLSVAFRVLIIFCPKLRVLMLKSSLIKLRQCSAANKLSNIMIGDWFLIHQLGKNIDKLVYFDFLELLARKLEPHKNDENNDVNV
jgi:hypothetical protein